MTSVSTWAKRRAFAPAAHRLLADTPSGKSRSQSQEGDCCLKGSSDLCWGNTAEVSVRIIMRQRCSKRRHIISLQIDDAPSKGSAPTTSPRTEFFCVVNLRVPKVAVRNSLSVAVL